MVFQKKKRKKKVSPFQWEMYNRQKCGVHKAPLGTVRVKLEYKLGKMWHLIGLFFYSSCFITCFLWYIHFIRLDAQYLTIVVCSTYADVLIALLDYYHNMLIFSYHMIFYPILDRYTLIVAYF